MCKEPLHLACSERVVREDRRGRKREEAEVTCVEKGKEKRAGEGEEESEQVKEKETTKGLDGCVFMWEEGRRGG